MYNSSLNVRLCKVNYKYKIGVAMNVMLNSVDLYVNLSGGNSLYSTRCVVFTLGQVTQHILHWGHFKCVFNR